MVDSLLSGRLSRLRIRHLLLLDLIAETGSLRGAASTLFVSQPAVTAMLQELESALGVRVVDRDQQGARLTVAGTIVQERLHLALNALHSIESMLLDSLPRPHLRVGVLSLAMLELIPTALSALRAEHPEITFEFTEGTVEEIINGVLTGKFDCAIGRVGSHAEALQHPDFQHDVLGDVQMHVVCAANNPIAKRSAVTLEDLQGEPWILLPRGTESREAFERAFSQAGLAPPAPTIESMSFVSNFHVAATTDLLTVSTSTAAEAYSNYGVIKPVNIVWPVMLSPLMFLSRKDALGLAAVRSFFSYIKKAHTERT